MLETYLFITPWGDECFNCEKETIRYFKHAEEKVDFKIVTVLNMNIVLKYIKRNRIKGADYNDLFSRMYLTSLDYKAACYQGKAKGRSFLTLMQTAIIDNGVSYSLELGSTIAKEVGLDLEMFELDRQSDMVQEEFKHDQQLAHEMGAEDIPAAVIFNIKDEECGILMEHYDYETLASVCQLKMIHKTKPQPLFTPKTL
ncbi:dithiol-disulfide isomerase [Pediococcus stilesii]|uniref:Dithiol-disulfide isomerase n=1 Tax=Pediococcus stilesii TaxID=331679 RepID=A0A5R9BTX0_9LACO|nr:DsbA family protein [Pediococcus stilesii]TLQ03441.1 dithiol-disulfide isomerase [Pediococcus stilesii]